MRVFRIFDARIQLIFASLLVASFAMAQDCNNNGIDDADDIAAGASLDHNQNAVPDECELTISCFDVLVSLGGPATPEPSRALAANSLFVFVGQPSSNNDAGTVQVFRRSSDTWTFIAELTSPNPHPGDQFGFALDATDTRLFVGTPGADIIGFNVGAVDVFERNGDTWTFASTIQPTTLTSGDAFGASLAYADDALVVGVPGANSTESPESGTALLLRKEGASWTVAGTLSSPSGLLGDEFGFAVDADDSWIAIGAPRADGESGRVSMFQRTKKSAVFVLDIVSPAPSPAARFGRAVSLDGPRLLVGAPSGRVGPGPPSGTAVLFERSAGVWSLRVVLEASDGSAQDEFGESVALLPPSLAYVGAPGNNTPTAGNAGAVYVFDTDGTSANDTKIVAGTRGREHRFGRSVLANADSLIVGARANDLPDGNVRPAYAFLARPEDCDGNNEADHCDLVIGDQRDYNNSGIIDACECITDLDGDKDTDLSDLEILLSEFGSRGRLSDVDGDGTTNLQDLSITLAYFGVICPE